MNAHIMTPDSALARMDLVQLHRRVYTELLPGIAAREGRVAAEQRLLRFKVLGGLGPAATADFLQELIAATPAANDRQHLRLDVKIDSLMGTVGENDDSVLPVTQMALDRLLADVDGPTAFCLPCNTAHWRIEHLMFDRNRITFVSMVDATVAAVQALLPAGAKVGLLATRRMVASGMYQSAFHQAGYAVFTPAAEVQQLVNTAIYGGTVDGQTYRGVKGGDTGPGATSLVQSAVDHLRGDHDIDVVCLSCTELPLLFGPQLGAPSKGNANGLPVVNSTRALAHSFVHHALRIQAQALLNT